MPVLNKTLTYTFVPGTKFASYTHLLSSDIKQTSVKMANIMAAVYAAKIKFVQEYDEVNWDVVRINIILTVKEVIVEFYEG